MQFIDDRRSVMMRDLRQIRTRTHNALPKDALS